MRVFRYPPANTRLRYSDPPGKPGRRVDPRPRRFERSVVRGGDALLAAARPEARVTRVALAELNLGPSPGLISGYATRFSEEYLRSGHTKLVKQAAADPRVPTGYLGSLRIADLIAPRFPTFHEVLYGLRFPRTFLLLHGVQVQITLGAGHDMMADNTSEFAAAVAAALE
ncbi:MAG: hypothetical protein ABFD77_11175 [Thermotogota bacterium]